VDYLNDLDPAEEIRQFFEVPEIDVYLERSDEVKQIYEEMRKLADLYVNTKSAKVVGTEGAVQEMYDELVQGRAALGVAIEKAKAAEAAAAIVEKNMSAPVAEPPKAAAKANPKAPPAAGAPAPGPAKRSRGPLPGASLGGANRTAMMATGGLVLSLVSLGAVGWGQMTGGERAERETAELRQTLKKELMTEAKALAETQELRLKQEIAALRSELARVDAMMNDAGRELAKLREIKVEERKAPAASPKKKKGRK